MPPKWGNTATFAYENFPWNTQICFGLSDQRHFNFKFVHINQKFVTLGSSLLIWKVSKWQCNWAGCYGALPRTDNSPSHSFCFNSSLKCLMTVSDVQFLSCFIDAKTPTKWKKLTTWWPNTPCAPPGTEGLTMLTPVTLPCYVTVNQAESCAWADHMPWDTKCFAQSRQGVWAFWALMSWTPCKASYNKCCTFLHHNLMAVGWLYCALWARGSRFWFSNSSSIPEA